MYRLTTLLIILVLLTGCTETRNATPAGNSSTQYSYVSLDEVTIHRGINPAEEGVVIFIKVTEDPHQTTGATVRYPEDGVVLSFEDNNRHVLSPKLLIPNKENVQVEVSIIAVPKDISNEAINIIGYLFTEIVTTVIPGEKIGKVLFKVADYTIGRATDEAKAYIQEGRLVGYATISAERLARQQLIDTPDFYVRAFLSNDTKGNIPVNPRDTNQSSPSGDLTGRILEPTNNAIVGKIVPVSGELFNLPQGFRAFLCIKSTAFNKKIYPQAEIFPDSNGQWTVRSIYGTAGYKYETFMIVTGNENAIATLLSEESARSGLNSLPDNTTRIGITIVVERE